jgi:hypothetical protein
MLRLGLRQRDDGLGENGCKHSVDCNRFEFRHFFTLLQSRSRYQKGLMPTRETWGALMRDFDAWVVN